MKILKIIPAVIALVVGGLAGTYGGYRFAGFEKNSESQRLILSNLRSDSILLQLFSNNDRAKVSELLLSRIQIDLMVFEDLIQSRELSIDQAKLCETTSYMNGILGSYLSAGADNTRAIRTSLSSLQSKCT